MVELIINTRNYVVMTYDVSIVLTKNINTYALPIINYTSAKEQKESMRALCENTYS